VARRAKTADRTTQTMFVRVKKSPSHLSAVDRTSDGVWWYNGQQLSTAVNRALEHAYQLGCNDLQYKLQVLLGVR